MLPCQILDPDAKLLPLYALPSAASDPWVALVSGRRMKPNAFFQPTTPCTVISNLSDDRPSIRVDPANGGPNPSCQDRLRPSCITSPYASVMIVHECRGTYYLHAPLIFYEPCLYMSYLLLGLIASTPTSTPQPQSVDLILHGLTPSQCLTTRAILITFKR